MQSPMIPYSNGDVVAERHVNTPGHIREIEDTDLEKVDVSAPIGTPRVLNIKKMNVAVRNTSSLNPVQESEESYMLVQGH